MLNVPKPNVKMPPAAGVVSNGNMVSPEQKEAFERSQKLAKEAEENARLELSRQAQERAVQDADLQARIRNGEAIAAGKVVFRPYLPTETNSSNWDILPHPDKTDGKIVARNSVTSRTFEGANKEFSRLLRGFAPSE